MSREARGQRVKPSHCRPEAPVFMAWPTGALAQPPPADHGRRVGRERKGAGWQRITDGTYQADAGERAPKCSRSADGPSKPRFSTPSGHGPSKKIRWYICWYKIFLSNLY